MLFALYHVNYLIFLLATFIFKDIVLAFFVFASLVIPFFYLFETTIFDIIALLLHLSTIIFMILFITNYSPSSALYSSLLGITILFFVLFLSDFIKHPKKTAKNAKSTA